MDTYVFNIPVKRTTRDLNPQSLIEEKYKGE